MNGFGFGFSAQLGTLLNSFKQFQPETEKLFYYWNNSSTTNSRNISLVSKWTNQFFGTRYVISKIKDLYEITDILKVKLVKKINSVSHSQSYDGSLNYSIGASIRCDKLTINGTSLKIKVNKDNNSGVFRAIIYNGVFRGFTTTNASGKNLLDSDKAENYYYVILETGDYSSIHPSLSSLNKYDLIHYVNSTWVIVPQANYTYIDVDTYNSTSITSTVDLFTGLSGESKIAVFPTKEKNAASSGYVCYPSVGANANYINGFTFTSYEDINYNWCETVVSLINTGTSHFFMSTRIKKNGTAQTAEWIPSHIASATLINQSADMQNWVDSTELTGYNLLDKALTEISNYRLTSKLFAVNPASALENLLDVEWELLADKDGITCNVKYEALIETEVTSGYAFMFPFYNVVSNKFITDLPEEKTLPLDGNNVNITDGCNRKNMFSYNNTPSGDYENIIVLMNITNPATTNPNPENQAYLYKYGTDYGKMYPPIYPVVWSVGHIWNTTVKITAGYVTGLINKVADYVS